MYIRVKVTPGAKKEVSKKTGEFEYEISVREKAERNMANMRVLEMLAKELGKNIGEIRLISGHHSRVKMFSIKE